MEDGYLFSAAKYIVSMQTLQAPAAVVFQRACNQSSYHAPSCSIADYIWSFFLHTVACILTNTFGCKTKIEGCVLCFDALDLLFHLFLVLVPKFPAIILGHF